MPGNRYLADARPFIGRYQVRGLLGRGGFAAVYRAWDPLLTREVALKVLLPECAGDTGLRARFLAEARVIAGLRHPGVVTVYEVSDAGDQPYFAMELIEGHTLAQATAGGRSLPLPDVIRIVERLCAAVDHLHRAGVLHRDIKAANVIVGADGRVVLMDFGIARTAGGMDTTRTGEILGTPVAMAPEQVRGEPAGPAADIYALGVLSYQLLAGRPPFTGEAVQVLHAHAYQAPPPLHAARAGLPSGVYAAIEAALHKDPARRPRPAAALAAALARGATAVPGQPGPDRSRRSAIRPGRRRSNLVTAGTGRLAAAALGGVVLLLLLARLLSDGRDTGQPGTAAPAAQPEPAAGPEVTGFSVYDNVFSRRELAFPVGDSIVACFTLRPGAGAHPLLLLVTNRPQPPDAGASAVVARSAPVPNEASQTCHTVPVLAPPLPAGPYWIWLLHDEQVLVGRSFVAQPKSGDILAADNFDDPTRGLLPQVSPDPAHFSVAYVDGAYAVAKTDPGFAGVPFVTIPGAFDDATLAFDVRLVGPAADRLVTLGCRTSSPALDNGYRFTLDAGRGAFLLDRWDAGRLTTLASGSAPAVQRDGRSNRVEMTCDGDTIAISVNGIRIAVVRDAAHRSGLLWFGVESDPSRRHSIEARFDNLVVVQQ